MRALILFTCFLVGVSCSSGQPQMETIHHGLDNTFEPGSNFYKYVNQIWMDASEPGTYPTSFSGVVQDTMKARFFRVLEETRKSKSEFYYLNGLKDQFFDWEMRDSLGIRPLEQELESIFGDSSNLATIFARMQKRGYATPFYFDLHYSGDTIYSRIRFDRESNASLGRYFDNRQKELPDSSVQQILSIGNIEIGEQELDKLMLLKHSIDELQHADYGVHRLSITEADSILSNFDLQAFNTDYYSSPVPYIICPPHPVTGHLDYLLEQYKREDWILLLKYYVIYENLGLLSEKEQEFVNSFNPSISNQRYYEMVCRLYLTRVLAKEYETRFVPEEDLMTVQLMIEGIQNEFYNKISASHTLTDLQKSNLKSHIEKIHFNYRIPDSEFFNGSFTLGDNLLETIREIGTQFNDRFNHYVFEGKKMKNTSSIPLTF